MINDDLLRYLADTHPVNIETQLFEEIQERARRKIQAMSDDELMEQYDYVSELAEDLRKRLEVERREGGNP